MSLDRPSGPRRREVCDRCGLTFSEGFRWSALGVPLVLCKDCTEDIEESASSYGEDGDAARRRLLDRLRNIGMEGDRPGP
jgi:hypothetical protein